MAETTKQTRCTRCMIVPPHILRAAAESGSNPFREQAQEAYRQYLFLIQNPNAFAENLKKEELLGEDEPLNARRFVYDIEHQDERSLRGKLVLADGLPLATPDRSANNVFEHFGAVRDFYQNVFGRNSIDNNGMSLHGVVHFKQNYPNAFWDSKEMVFGDGDGRIFGDFTESLDVVGHELTHGVTEHTLGLVYSEEPGALNEHISDVFGILIKQRALQQRADQADWLIGAEVLIDSPSGEKYALRSMKAPGTAYLNHPDLGNDPQPDNYSNLYTEADDNGGVHINSGIPNKAFYLVATAFGGFAWEKAGKIWYETITNPPEVSHRNRSLQFKDFADFTHKTAMRLYGKESNEARIVKEAWNEVGVHF